MITFTNTIDIHRPADQVFAYVGDLEHTPEWNWAITSTRKIGSGPVGVGTEYHQTRSVPRPGSETLRITRFEPPHAIALEGTLGPFQARLHYQMAGTGDRTTIVNTVELDASGILGLAAPALARRIQTSVADNLRVLKDLLEDPTRRSVAAGG